MRKPSRTLLSTCLLLAVASLSINAAEARTMTLRVGGLYCVSEAAIKEYFRTQNDEDWSKSRDGLYDILWVRKLCDYSATPIVVLVVGDKPRSPSVKVQVPGSDQSWRKGSKII